MLLTRSCWSMTMQLRSQQRKRALATAIAAVAGPAGGRSDSDGRGEVDGDADDGTPKKRGVKKPRARSLARKAAPANVVSTAKAIAVEALPLIPSTPGDRILHTYDRLVPARLLRRYKRFLADVVLLEADEESTEAIPEDSERIVTVYCPNTGPMVGLLDDPYARVQLSRSDDPKRKYAYTLEMVRVHNGERHVWVGVHSASANYMIERALRSRWLIADRLGAYSHLQREVRFAKDSRVDFVLSRTDAVSGAVTHQTYVEVKSVTLAQEILDEGDDADAPPTRPRRRIAVFPDTVSTRAQKHVTELLELVKRSVAKTTTTTEATESSPSPPGVTQSGAIVFVIQRDDCETFMPSLAHDPAFAELCAAAERQGIELLGYSCRLEPNEAQGTGVVRLLGPAPLDPQRRR